MEGWMILVFLLSSINNEKLAIKVSHLGEEQLIFEAREDCVNHVKENAISLMAFALSEYGPDKYIDKIVCTRNDESSTL
jgi:hypothetical protein